MFRALVKILLKYEIFLIRKLIRKISSKNIGKEEKFLKGTFESSTCPFLHVPGLILTVKSDNKNQSKVLQ